MDDRGAALLALVGLILGSPGHSSRATSSAVEDLGTWQHSSCSRASSLRGKLMSTALGSPLASGEQADCVGQDVVKMQSWGRELKVVMLLCSEG